jgi:protein involved in polysaccharide export with SLBB domain
MKNIISLGNAFIFIFCTSIYSSTIIKNGDVLDIHVMQHPEFSGRYTVNDQGVIDYPLYAEEPVVNISTVEMMNDLTFRLARHVDNPLVLITIIDKPEITITVLGQVVNPGPVKTFDGATIQEVLISAGGPTPSGADLARIKIIHNDKGRAADVFNLESFLQKGNVEDLPRLEADDIVIVLAQEKSKKVKVIGAVQKPGLFTLEEKMNLFELIYLAGGPTEKADLSRVRRFTRQSDEKVTEEIVDIQGYIDKGRMDNIPDVMEGDVVIVYGKWFDWKTLLTVLNNTLLFIVTIQAFAGIFK